MKYLKAVKNFFKKIVENGLIEIIILTAEVVTIGLLQVAFEYGSIKIYAAIYLLARLHPLFVKLYKKGIN